MQEEKKSYKCPQMGPELWLISQGLMGHRKCYLRRCFCVKNT